MSTVTFAVAEALRLHPAIVMSENDRGVVRDGDVGVVGLGAGRGGRGGGAAAGEEQAVRRAGAGVGDDARRGVGDQRGARPARAWAAGVAPRTSAAAPATCGEAIDVPLIVLVAVSLVFHGGRDVLAGAKMSVQVPKLENDARASVLVVAFDGDAPRRTRAGVKLQALAFELPDGDRVRDAVGDRARGSAFSTPRRPLGAEAHVRDGRPGRVVAVTQSTPAMTPANEPLPAQSSTLTATSLTLLGHAVRRAADRAGDVRAVAVAVGVGVPGGVDAPDAPGRRSRCGWCGCPCR